MISGFQAPQVSELVGSIKEVLEDQFQEVMVQGEVTNLSPSSAGRWYFSLSDEQATISCALFKGDALRNPLIKNLKNGDKIIISGPISVYLKRGSFQLLVKRLFPAGEGQLKLQFERLKARLSQEGLFDLEKKKVLPSFPKRIAVITAQHGAALQDFLNVMKRRSLWMDILIIPALVQGEGAPKSLIQAIEKVQQFQDIDVIVLTRGGGSLEDLWAFNDETLVRKISTLKVPVISAVGHQIDYTLCDYVADYRAETPTAAAEILSQPQTELGVRLDHCHSRLRSNLFKMFQSIQLMIHKFHPRELLNLMNQKIHEAEKKLNQNMIFERGEKLMRLPEANQLLDEALIRLKHGNEIYYSGLTQKILRLEHVLMALNPAHVLSRGFCYVRNKSGDVVTNLESFGKIPQGENFEIQFRDGKASALKG